MRQKRMALINDITGFGRCSIAVMAPIISTMRIQAVPVSWNTSKSKSTIDPRT